MARRARSTKTGRFVSKVKAKRSPNTTLIESTGASKGTVTIRRARSAITGRFLGKAAAARHPDTTVVETIKQKK